MTISLKRQNEAFDILRNYEGENPYILVLKKRVYVDGDVDAVKDFQVEFILKNKDFKPIKINKIIKVADWWGEKKKEDWGTEFVPEKIKVVSYLGDTDTTYVCYIQYRQSVDPIRCFIPKKAVLTDFLAKDYKNLEVDFDRYDRLSDFKRVLFPHQKEAVKFLLTRKKCILADGMGLGKTTEMSVAAIEGNFDSILIICPASLKTNWKRELSFYIPEKDITVIDGFNDKTKGELEVFLGYAEGKSGMKREELLQEAKDVGKWKFNRFVILNYDVLDEFYKIPATRKYSDFEDSFAKSPLLQYITNRKSLLIVDEAHNLSNPKSNRYKIIKSLIRRGKPESIYLATGTPITNNPGNLYSVLDLLQEDITSDWAYYMKRYCGAIEMVSPKDKAKRDSISREYIKRVGAANWYQLTGEQKEELQNKIRKECKMLLIQKDATNLDELKDRLSHIYLRRTKESLELPEKRVHEVYYDLTPSQEAEYEKLWDEYEKAQNELDPDKEINKDLLEGGLYRRYLSNEMVPNTEKLADALIERGNKVVIACCYDEELYTLKEYYGDKAVIFNGKCSLKQKDEAVDAFMNDDNIKVFIGNINAAGVGITLVSSSKLIFNNMSFVPGDNEQMSDRIHRIGQMRDVDIYYQIFRGTQYEHMWNIVLKKSMVIDRVIKNEAEKKES